MHHANLVLGTKSAALTFLETVIDTPLIDRVTLDFDQIGIDEAHSLVDSASRIPVAGAYRAIIVTCRTLTTPAQNALLKLFEEPAPTTRFFLCLPSDTLLPTLRSRLELIYKDESVSGHEHGKRFLSSSYTERLSEIAVLTKKKDDLALITLGREILALTANVHDPMLLRDLMLLSANLELSGASKKMLLEHIALSLPIEREVR